MTEAVPQPPSPLQTLTGPIPTPACLRGGYPEASLEAQTVKNLPAVQESWVQSLGWEDPLEKGMATQLFLPGESHGQRSLAGCSPWGHKEADKTE